MTPRFVRYVPGFLLRIVFLLTTMTIICAYVGSAAASSTGPRAKLAAVALCACSGFFALMVLFVLLPRLITKNPVMAITDEGLLIDFLILEKPILLRWADVRSIRSIEGQICIMPFDTERYVRERPFWSRWIYLVDVAKYGTFFRLAPTAFDISWDEFMALVPARLRNSASAETSEPPPGGKESHSSLDDYLRTLKLFEWVQSEPGTRLNTAEDYVRQFTRNLVGTWSNDDGMMPSPVSKDVVFREDGTGCVQGVFFTEYSGKFEWREKDDRLIEVCSVDESPTWFPLRWNFGGAKSTQLNIWRLDSDGGDAQSSEKSELIGSLLCDPLYLSDKRGWKNSSNGDEIPSDAQEITIGGETAWLSKGSTYWKLRQGQYKVTVANVNEDGLDRHFFSIDFIAPVSGRHLSGTYDHAPGHVDRRRFLEVAERILPGLRSVK